ncbi:cytochrome b [Terrarubrum flagellatum]|uniref:cytochrome b n=1 Tax=Terrirubrum flagellatum TaxID=2895980 RepID=UPI00314521ED
MIAQDANESRDDSVRAEEAVGAWPLALRIIHWLSAAVIVGLLSLGLYMRHADIDAGEAFDLYQLHKSFGFIALALILLRVIARVQTRRPPFPETMSRREVVAARLTHAAFYALLLALPLIGWVMVSAAPLPVPTRFFDLVEIPALTAPSESVYGIARRAHRLAAWALGALLLLHAAAAMKHHWLDRDSTLRRMWFTRRG